MTTFNGKTKFNYIIYLLCKRWCETSRCPEDRRWRQRTECWCWASHEDPWDLQIDGRPSGPKDRIEKAFCFPSLQVWVISTPHVQNCEDPHWKHLNYCQQDLEVAIDAPNLALPCVNNCLLRISSVGSPGVPWILRFVRSRLFSYCRIE